MTPPKSEQAGTEVPWRNSLVRTNGVLPTGRKLPRKLRVVLFWLDRALFGVRIAVGFLQLGLFCYLCHRFPVKEYGGIKIVSLYPEIPEAAGDVLDALRLIHTTDPRRFRRLQRCIRRIMISPLRRRTLANYQPVGCICSLSLLPCSNVQKDLRVFGYAVLLVHESTHGMLVHHAIRHSRGRARCRAEKLCCREENRFATRFPVLYARRALVFSKPSP